MNDTTYDTTTRAPSLLEVDGISKTYRSAAGDVEVIRDLTFALREGEFACIVGPSGAGKTTLLRSIAGLQPVTTGEVRVNGARISSPPPGMAVVFQEYGRSLFPWWTVARNIEMPLVEEGVPRARRRELVERSIEAVGLAGSASSYPWQLSGGMQQRVAIARAVAYEPKVLLMDEPFAAVDAQTRADLEDLVRSLWQRLGVTVMFVTHDIDESIYLGSRVLVLSDRPTEILADVAVDLGAEREQLTTRAEPRFAELRAEVYRLIQAAKRGLRPAAVA